MRGKSMILIVIALGCGLVASIGISQILDRGGSKTPQAQTKKIFVAVRDVDISEVLDAETIKLEEWPVEKIPEGAVMKLEEVKGLTPNQRLFAGEPIRKEKLVDPLKSSGASTRIPKGYRVQAIKVKAEDIVGGIVTPGDHVDVLVYLRQGGMIKQTTSRTVLEDVRVFGINAQTQKEVDEQGNKINAKTVSLLLKPAQVQTLLLASRLGQINLSLRNPDDNTTTEASEGAGIADLINAPPQDATPQSDVRDRQMAASAKSAAGNFKDFWEKTLATSSQPAQSDQVASAGWQMIVMGPEGMMTYEVANDSRMSVPQLVSGPGVTPAAPAAPAFVPEPAPATVTADQPATTPATPALEPSTGADAGKTGDDDSAVGPDAGDKADSNPQE
jgi:pilus assembly protein CpaB